METPHTPPFYFKLDWMAESSDCPPNIDQHGNWSPPKNKGRNVISGTVASYCCDGISIQPVHQIPPDATAYKAYSMYYNQGAFWTLNYDATAYRVGDGIDNSSSNDGRRASDARDDSYWSSWRTLSFEHPEGRATSTVCYGGDKTRLRSQSQSQRWVNAILPSTYHSTNTTGQGGLIGELPLILGLLAFSIEYWQITWMFQTCFQNGFWTNTLHSGHHGRVDRRGMVVRVYSYPGYSTTEELANYERGSYGPIFS